MAERIELSASKAEAEKHQQPGGSCACGEHDETLPELDNHPARHPPRLDLRCPRFTAPRRRTGHLGNAQSPAPARAAGSAFTGRVRNHLPDRRPRSLAHQVRSQLALTEETPWIHGSKGFPRCYAQLTLLESHSLERAESMVAWPSTRLPW